MYKIILPVCIAIVFASCTSATFIQHTPTLANTGQHTEKGQLHGNLLYSSATSSSNAPVITGSNDEPYEQVNGIQAKGSYSISNSLAVQSSYMHSAEKGGSITSNQKNIVYNYNRNVTEAGLAFYDNLGSGNNFFIELGTGLGIGNNKATEVSSTLTPGGRFYNHNIFKLYFQPSLYFVSKIFCVSFGGKLSHINFNDIQTNYTALERQDRSITTNNKLSTTTLDFFTKFDVFLNKLPWLGFNFQALYSSDLEKKFNHNQNDNNIGLGLSFRLDKINQKK